MGGYRSEEAQVTVMSFSEVALRRVRRLAPGVPLVMLMERVPVAYRSGMLPKGVRVAGPGLPVVQVHPNYVRRVQNAGSRVFVWTVDKPDDVKLCVRHGRRRHHHESAARGARAGGPVHRHGGLKETRARLASVQA